VRNNGPAVITELHLWIEDGDEEYISSGDRLVNLGTGETMFASLGVLKENRHGQRLMVQWTDAEGEYGPLWTGIRPPLEL
jgi:hypothetical protein